MIPTIETIVEDLAEGLITKQQAIEWLYMHAEGTANDLRDHFASQAMIGCMSSSWAIENIAKGAYAMADAMMIVRGKK